MSIYNNHFDVVKITLKKHSKDIKPKNAHLHLYFSVSVFYNHCTMVLDICSTQEMYQPASCKMHQVLERTLKSKMSHP